MPQLKVTLDDTSPLISYSGSWQSGNNPNAPDPAVNLYYASTFMMTTDNSASATIQWQGAGDISVYGSKRGNHGNYRMTLDNVPSTGSGFAMNPELFQQVLFSKTVGNGQHTLQVNDVRLGTAQVFFDLDYVVITSEVGANTASADSSNKAFSFSSGWSATRSGMSTPSSGNSVTLPFSGDSIEIYGLVGRTAGAYTVAIDGGNPRSFSAYNQYHVLDGQIIYMVRGLSDGPHTIVLTNTPDGQGNTLSVSRVTVHGSQPLIGQIAVPAPSDQPTHPTAPQSPTPDSTTPSISDPNPAGTSTTSASLSLSSLHSSTGSTVSPSGDALTITLNRTDSATVVEETSAPVTLHDHKDSDSGIPTGAIIGIVTSVVLLLVLFIITIVIICRRKRKDTVLEKSDSFASNTVALMTSGAASLAFAASFSADSHPRSPTMTEGFSTVMGGITPDEAFRQRLPQLSEKQRLRAAALQTIARPTSEGSDALPSMYASTEGESILPLHFLPTVRREEDFGPYDGSSVTLPPAYSQATRRS